MYCSIWLAEDVVLLYDKCNEVYYINILMYNIEKKDWNRDLKNTRFVKCALAPQRLVLHRTRNLLPAGNIQWRWSGKYSMNLHG